MSIKQKSKTKPPLCSLAHTKNGVSAEELENIANVLTGQAKVFTEKPKDDASVNTTNSASPSVADKLGALDLIGNLNKLNKSQSIQKRIPSPPAVEPEAGLKSTTQSCSEKPSKLIDITGSLSLPHSAGLEPVSIPDSKDSISSTNSKTATTKESSTSSKSTSSERYVIDLCLSTDESTVEQEEPPAFDEDEDDAYTSHICLPKLLNYNVLPTSEATDLKVVGQNAEYEEETEVSVPVLPYPEEEPKSSSDYAKTPPIQPFDTTAMTPPSNISVATDMWDKSWRPTSTSSISKAVDLPTKNTQLLDSEQDPTVRKHSNTTSNTPDYQASRSPLTYDSHLPSLPSRNKTTPSKKPPAERKGRSESSSDVPSKISRKRSKVPDNSDVKPGKSKKVRVSENGAQYDIRFIVVECVKKCIHEVNSKLDRSRFKLLCRSVSKRVLGSWSERKSPRQRSIHRWLKHRHVKIVRLVEKYLEKNLI